MIAVLPSSAKHLVLSRLSDEPQTTASILARVQERQLATLQPVLMPEALLTRHLKVLAEKEHAEYGAGQWRLTPLGELVLIGLGGVAAAPRRPGTDPCSGGDGVTRIRRHSDDHLVLGTCACTALLPSEVAARARRAQVRAGVPEAQQLSERATLPTLRNLQNLRPLAFGNRLTAEGENVLDELGPWAPK